MRHFTAAEPDRHLDFVAFVQETTDAPHLDLIVVFVDAGAHFDFLDVDDFLFLAGLVGFFLRFVFVFAVIEDLAHRRIGVGRHLDKVESRLKGDLYSFFLGNDADHLSVGVNNTNFFGFDLFVDARTHSGRRLVKRSSDYLKISSPRFSKIPAGKPLNYDSFKS